MPSRVDFYVSQPNYAAHLAPIWHALDPAERGRWHVANPRLRAPAVAEGVAVHDMAQGWPSGPLRPCVVAGGTDAAGMRQRPCILVEHGVGQAYDVDHPSYSGGCRRGSVALFLCPNEVVARRNADAYPEAQVAIIGSPRLDQLRQRATSTDRTTAALSFHWDCRLTPESRWALPHYERALPDLVAALRKAGHEVIGHGHPRFSVHFSRLWQRLGVEHVRDFTEVVDRAWLYVCDNSSTLYEWAALGRPVVVLDAPWYRQSVDLWPRFWSCADVGVRIADPLHLQPAVLLGLLDPPAVRARRQAIVDEVTPLLDGQGAQRAAAAIRSVLRDGSYRPADGQSLPSQAAVPTGPSPPCTVEPANGPPAATGSGRGRPPGGGASLGGPDRG